MVVDLGPLTRLMTINGAFNAEKGSDPSFAQPQMAISARICSPSSTS